jgi:hypothetical protein
MYTSGIYSGQVTFEEVVGWTPIPNNAEIVLSGDRHLLALRQFKGIPVMTAA